MVRSEKCKHYHAETEKVVMHACLQTHADIMLPGTTPLWSEVFTHVLASISLFLYHYSFRLLCSFLAYCAGKVSLGKILH